MSAPSPMTALTAPGAPFEIGERNGLRQFVNAPGDLNAMIERARAFGDKTFIVEEADDGSERRLSFEDVFALRDKLVPLLKIHRGERVAICMRNRAEWIVAFMAVIKAGGIAALLNSRGSPDELVGMIHEVTPELVIADGERARLIREGGYAGRLFDLTQPFDEAEIARRTAIAEVDTTAPHPDDACVILFTSGTTGRVKGAVLSHRNLITCLLSVQLSGMVVLHTVADQMGVPVEQMLAHAPQQAVLLVFPLFHISGLATAFLTPLLSGTKVVIMRRWDVAEALRLITSEKVTMFTGVPTMLWDVLHNAKLADADLSTLRNIGTGGQALPVNLLHEILDACPHAMLGGGYGMTETAGAIAQAVGETYVRKPTAAGKVIPMFDVRIVGPEGQDMPLGESGEIVVRGPQIMLGYWNRPDDTAAVLSADGWLKTGDVGMLDDEGYIYIVDRKKDMVISGGENIYCAEVERVLGEMPQITECAAFGIPDERLGERLVTVVRAHSVGEDEVIQWVAERLAKYKAPGHVAFAAESLPRNHVGKVDKNILRARWTELYKGS